MMAKKISYVKYAQKRNIDTQSVYVDSSSAYKIVGELSQLDVRRILFISDKTNRKFSDYDKLLDYYRSSGFRVVEYTRESNQLYDKDILEGLRIFEEYSCNCIIAMGNADTIDCGKLVAAATYNMNKSVNELVGVGKLKKDIPYLCCIATDISSNSASCYADFVDFQTGKISTAVSFYLVPHIVVIDTEFAMRTDLQTCLHSSLMALATAIESYLSENITYSSEYKADAINACRNILTNIDNMKADSTDSYTRRKMMVGAYYSGLSNRKVGIGQAHVLMHCLANNYKYKHSTGMAVIFPAYLNVLRNASESKSRAMADLSRELHLCTKSLDNNNAALNLIDRITYLYQDIERMGYYPTIGEDEAMKIANEVVKECQALGVEQLLDKDDITTVIMSLADSHS